MDTKPKRGIKRARPHETPDTGHKSRAGGKTEDFGRDYPKGTPSPLKFVTKEEMVRREHDEVCAKHKNPIVAFEAETGETLCEKCVYLGEVVKPVFTAVVAKDIKRRFDTELETFERLYNELMAIDKDEVRARIQRSITQLFDSIRDKCDELEEKTVAKIETSQNLNELISTLNAMHEYLEETAATRKYDSEKTKLNVKVTEIRYTYVCQRKQAYDKIISNLIDDNKKIADSVETAKSMINSIFECSQDDPKVPKTLNELVSSLMLIDKKMPDFDDDSHLKRSGRKFDESNQEEDSGLIKQEIPFTPSEHKEENWKAEEMSEAYFNKENTLCKREIKDDKVVVTDIMDLKLFLQKVITVPLSRGSRVFLFGGAKDSSGAEAINNCYEVNLKRKTMNAVDKLSSAKLSFAAALSPDAKIIYIAGGSTGQNKSTNEVEAFDVSKRKWSKLPVLNQPRFSASLISCENEDLYCFGGVDNDPKDPTKFFTVKSIETLDLTDENAQWESLKLQLPYKTSSPGAISLGGKAFIVFGGWNKATLKNSYIIRAVDNDEYTSEECGDMAVEDTFVFNGLVSRNEDTKESVIFGIEHAHIFNENDRTFSVIE